MSQLQQVMQHLPMAVNFAIHCRTYSNKSEGGAGYHFECENRTRGANYDYRTPNGEPSTNKKVAEILNLSTGRTAELYKQYEGDWEFIYENYTKPARAEPKKQRVWLDHNCKVSSVEEIRKHYLCDVSTVRRAFASAKYNTRKAHKILAKRKEKAMARRQAEPSKGNNNAHL